MVTKQVVDLFPNIEDINEFDTCGPNRERT